MLTYARARVTHQKNEREKNSITLDVDEFFTFDTFFSP